MRKTKKPEDRKVWEKRFKEFQASGKSQVAWCKEKNINPNTFNTWYLRLKAEQKEPKKEIKESVKWLAIDTKEIKLEANVTSFSGQAINIKIANATIEIMPGFVSEHLLNIITTLNKLC